MMNNLFDKINADSFISNNDVILIGLSGGADSIFLAEFFVSIRDKYCLTLKAAHIEHGIRGQESMNDCLFVEQYCKENNIECSVLHIDALTEAKKAGVGVEEYSRNKRYEFFNSIQCDKIATAHNLSDNIETIIFRLARGTSIKGLCGIPAIRGKIIRPLLNITGREIRQYLDDNGIKYCIDATNSENDYSRNHIRNNILPLFTDLNSNYSASIKRLIDSVNEDNSFIECETDRLYADLIKNNAIDLSKLRMLHISVVKRVIIKYFNLHGISLNDCKINEILSLMNESGKIQLSGNTFAVSNKNTLRFADFSEASKKTEFMISEKQFGINEFLNKCELCGKKFDFYCDCDKIVGSVAVRHRLGGDKITPVGRNCTKSLKKLFNELQIPAEIRDNIPIITDDNGIIGIYGYCIDERVAVSDFTQNVLILNVSTEDKI